MIQPGGSGWAADGDAGRGKDPAAAAAAAAGTCLLSHGDDDDDDDDDRDEDGWTSSTELYNAVTSMASSY